MKTLCMNAMVRRTSSCVLLCLCVLNLFSKTIYTSTGGTSGTPLDWSASGTWSATGSGTPIVHVIRSGHYVNFNANNGTPYVDTVFLYGNLVMANNKVMKLTGGGVLALMNNVASISGGSANTQFEWDGTGVTLTGPFTSSNVVTGGPRYATANTVTASGGNIQNSFVYGLLSVELYDFKTSCGNSGLDFYWNVATEINVDRYEIFGSPDLKKWQFISATNASATSGSEKQYTYHYTTSALPRDANKSDSAVLRYFRITCFDKDHNYVFSNIVVVSCQSSQPMVALDLNAAPNPASGEQLLLVSMPKVERVSIIIFSETGSIIRKTEIVSDYADEVLKMDLRNLAPGVYTVAAITASESKSITLVRQ